MTRRANAYRVVKKELADLYSTNPDTIPNLEGKNFINENGDTANTFKYDPDKRYLHFFTKLSDAEKYKLSIDATDKEYAILSFNFDEKLLKVCKQQGKYVDPTSFNGTGFRDIILDEYIMPAEMYSTDNCLGEARSGGKKEISYDPDQDSYGWF